MNKVVVFDLDDTLYKEIDFLRSAYHELSMVLESKYALSNVYSLLWESYSQGLNAFNELNKSYGIDISLNDFLSIYRLHIPKIALSIDTRKVLEVLVQKEVCLGVLTDGRAITQSQKMKSLGLDEYIPMENWIISENIGFEKPSLKGYLYFQEKYFSDSSSYYYVGDNTDKDFKAPNKLKWESFCLLDNGSNIHKQNFSQSKEMLPTHILNNIVDLLKYI